MVARPACRELGCHDRGIHIGALPPSAGQKEAATYFATHVYAYHG